MKALIVSAMAAGLVASFTYFVILPPQIVELASPFEEAGGNFGRAVDGLGDINGDGYSDLLVGADLEDVDGLSAAGRAYVFDGQSGDTLASHVSPEFQVNGRFGGSVTGLSDVNSDGVRDYAIAAWNEEFGGTSGVGRVYVYSGMTHQLVRQIESPLNEAGGSFGSKIALAGDVSGDGVGDIVVGALGQDGAAITDAGIAYVFNGATGSVIHTLTSPNPEVNGVFGSWVAGVGDLNSDGRGEIVVGAFFEERDSSPFASGAAYVFDGSSGSAIMSLNSTNEVSDGHFGAYVSAAGDLDGDLVPDILVGARSENGANVDDGRVYAFSGDTGDTLFTLISPNPEFEGLFGSVAPAGDVNLDGYHDFFVGAAGENGKAGRVYLFSGFDRDTLFSIVSPNSDPGGVFGARLEGAGDVNNDGVLDVIVSATRDNPAGSPVDAGRAYVILVNTDGTVGIEDTPLLSSVSMQAYPNPFRESISVSVDGVGVSGPLELRIVDVVGSEVASFTLEAGGNTTRKFQWNGTDAMGAEAPAGIYFITARVGDQVWARPVIRLR